VVSRVYGYSRIHANEAYQLRAYELQGSFTMCSNINAHYNITHAASFSVDKNGQLVKIVKSPGEANSGSANAAGVPAVGPSCNS
jgi:hypothetical protein